MTAKKKKKWRKRLCQPLSSHTTAEPLAAATCAAAARSCWRSCLTFSSWSRISESDTDAPASSPPSMFIDVGPFEMDELLTNGFVVDDAAPAVSESLIRSFPVRCPPCWLLMTPECWTSPLLSLAPAPTLPPSWCGNLPVPVAAIPILLTQPTAVEFIDVVMVEFIDVVMVLPLVTVTLTEPPWWFCCCCCCCWRRRFVREALAKTTLGWGSRVAAVDTKCFCCCALNDCIRFCCCCCCGEVVLLGKLAWAWVKVAIKFAVFFCCWSSCCCFIRLWRVVEFCATLEEFNSPPFTASGRAPAPQMLMPFCGLFTVTTISIPVSWSQGLTPTSRFSHMAGTTSSAVRLPTGVTTAVGTGWGGFEASRGFVRPTGWAGNDTGADMTSFFTSSSVGGATKITGSLMTPHVRLIGPDGRKGLFVKGRTVGICLLIGSRFFFADLSLALLLWLPSPGVPARLKSKQPRSAVSPRNLAICGFDRNFFPQGLLMN